jgi:MoxR-like ATPase
MLKLRVGYPQKHEEKEIMRRMAGRELRRCEQVARRNRSSPRAPKCGVYMDEKIEDYIVSIVHATREPGDYGIGHHATDPVRRVAACQHLPGAVRRRRGRSCRAAATCCRTT